MLNQIRRLLLLSGIMFCVVGCEGLTIETIQGPVGDTAGSGDTGGSEADTGGDTALDIGAADTEVDTATDTVADAVEDTATDTVEDTATDTATDTIEDTADVCPASYHMESGGCVSDTRSCSPLPANTTAGTQTWDSSTMTYGSCVATACDDAYDVYFGVCEFGQPVGATCGSGEDCTSDNCATAPGGIGSNRCAPSGMNYIPAGTFTMGSPEGEVGRGFDETQHMVTISRSFFLGQTEVTQGQWKALSGGANPSCFQSTTGTACTTSNANDSGPVEQIDWFAAVAFANAKSAAEGLTSCYVVTGCSDPINWTSGNPFGCADASFAGLSCTGYRLPTEAEWEFAARSSTTTSYYWGASSDPAYYWFAANAGSQTTVAKSKLPNALGLYDMSGNVSEWVNDRYDGNYFNSPVTDPLGGTTTGTGYRSARGGSYLSLAPAARSAARLGAYTPQDRFQHLGFRLARTAP